MRSSKELLLASKQYAEEIRWKSWWHLWSTLAIYAGFVTVACLDVALPLRIVASLLSALLLVRLFIIYHDFEHGAILRGSPVAAAVMYLYGLLALNPASTWNRSHNHHHQNNSKVFGANIGSFPIMTTEAYASATFWERIYYRASRHWLTIALGYFTVFLIGMCLQPFLASPKRHWDSGLAIVLHVALIAVLTSFGWDVLLLALIGPYVVACGLGAYLFYAQHNFPDVQFRKRSEWNHVFAALHSSSFIKMNRVLYWFTGNISYHHVHHLNARIPFYRLPEAMAGLEELQTPRTTSLHPREILRCLSLKLWDNEQGRLVSFRDDPRGGQRNNCGLTIIQHILPNRKTL